MVFFWALGALAAPYGDFNIDEPEVLGDNMFLLPNGAGAPSVQYSDYLEKFVIAFEAEITPPVGCTEAYEVRFATATDADGPFSLLSVKIGTLTGSRPCGAREPAFVIMDGGGWYISYKVLDTVGSRITGVGSGSSSGFTTSLAGTLNDLDELSMAYWNSTWYVWGIDTDPASSTYGQYLESTSTDFSTWATPARVVDPTSYTWTYVAMYSPSTFCYDGDDDVKIWALGENSSGQVTFNSNDMDINPSLTYDSMFTQSPFEYTWTTVGNDTWRNLDAIMSWNGVPGMGIVLMYYEDVDSTGNPRIGLASEGLLANFDPVDRFDRDCDP